VIVASGGAAAPAPVDAPPPAEAVSDNRFPVLAPPVGTFYRAPQPGANPFVQEGDTVDKGQTVAIVEAMKILNHVETEQAGRVVEILLKDGDWVEFQQPLMYLEPVEE